MASRHSRIAELTLISHRRILNKAATAKVYNLLKYLSSDTHRAGPRPLPLLCPRVDRLGLATVRYKKAGGCPCYKRACCEPISNSIFPLALRELQTRAHPRSTGGSTMNLDGLAGCERGYTKPAARKNPPTLPSILDGISSQAPSLTENADTCSLFPDYTFPPGSHDKSLSKTAPGVSCACAWEKGSRAHACQVILSRAGDSVLARYLVAQLT